MLFTRDLVDGLPADRHEALRAVCDRFFDFHNSISVGEESLSVEEYVEAHAVLSTLLEVMEVPYEIQPIDVGLVVSSPRSIVNGVVESFSAVHGELTKEGARQALDAAQELVRLAYVKRFGYEFSQGDLERVQTLLNELRAGIQESIVFAEEHKRRLLLRLEKLQAEMHKRVSDLDRFWGVIIEAGVVLGRFGKEVKPLTDRIREILQIIWTTQAGSLGLPSTTPFSILPAPGSHEVDGSEDAESPSD